jgi:hypothetical protein
LGVLAGDEQRAREADRDLCDAHELLDVAPEHVGVEGVRADVVERGAGVLGRELAAPGRGVRGVVVVAVARHRHAVRV